MKRNPFVVTVAALLTVSALIAGCGSASHSGTASNNATQTSSKPMIIGGGTYQGPQNLARLEKNAKAHPKDANALVEAAKGAYVNGKFSEALDYYRKAIQADPKSPVAYNNLGNVYFRGFGRPKLAIPYYQDAIKADKTYAFAWFNLAMAQKAAGEAASAKATLKKALKVVPKTDAEFKSIQKELQTLGK